MNQKLTKEAAKKPSGKKEAEEKRVSNLLEDLSLLEAYARELFSFSPLPLCSVSPIGVILEANPAFERISGYSIYEVVGEPVEKLFDKREIEEVSKETLEKGFIEAKEVSLLTKDRRKALVSAFSQVKKNPEGETVGYLLGLFDLSTIKKTESALKSTQTAVLNILEDVDEARRTAEEERDKTQAIITDLTDGLLVFNEEDKLVLINPQAENYLRVKSKQVAGKSAPEFAKFKDFKVLTDLLERDRRKKLFREELQLRENLTVEVSTTPLRTKEEKIGTLVIVHNISREKVVEKLKTEFVSITAHQLRTPLSAIKWALRMLLEGDMGPMLPEQTDYIEKTAASTERMITLIGDLLNVTRIEEGRFLYKPVPAQVKTVIQSVIDSQKEEVEKKKLKFEFRKPKKKPPRVSLDVEKMELAFGNILGNAIAYTPSGGEVTVTLDYSKLKKEIEISVEDTGIGIPKDQQHRVFTKFFRGANAIRMETEGTGLGLFIAKNIIEAHGGRIWFESEEGRGTTFYFTLPAKKEEFKQFLERL